MAQPALAGTNTLRDVLFGERQPADDRKAAAPMVARYSADNAPSFVLDKSTGVPLLKFEGSNEIWVLSASPAPRGDVIYRNDLGQPVLRATKLGGVTLFAPSSPGGAPAAVAGAAAALRVQTMNATALLKRLAQASVLASRAAQRLVVFDASDVRPGTEGLYADAALVTAEAMMRLSRVKGGKPVLARIGKVELTEGKHADANLRAKVLRITVNPARGIAGRPSSNRVIAAAAKGR
ncbi:MAG: DUF4908 domain-containing protein [Caulobacteraceae bacterium]